MNKILIFLVLVIASSEAILNGELTPNKPYYARITYRQTGSTTLLNRAGTILTDRYILTTGSFFNNAEDVRVWVGSYLRAQQQGHPVVGRLRLSNLPEGPALLQLGYALNFTQSIHGIRMIPNERLMGLVNEQGQVLGMGGVVEGNSRDRLNAAYMRIVTPEACINSYPTRNATAFFCAYDAGERTDFCPEDEGTSLTVIHRGEEFLVGMAMESVCSIITQTRPSLFASISFFRTRINEIINDRGGF